MQQRLVQINSFNNREAKGCWRTTELQEIKCNSFSRRDLEFITLICTEFSGFLSEQSVQYFFWPLLNSLTVKKQPSNMGRDRGCHME